MLGSIQVAVGSTPTLLYTFPKDDMEIEIRVLGGAVWVGDATVTSESGYPLIYHTLCGRRLVCRKAGDKLYGVSAPDQSPSRVAIFWSWR